MDKAKFGKQLAALRDKNGVTKYRVVKNGGLTFQQVKSIEEGKTNYTIDSLIAYIEVSKIKLDLK